MARALPACEPPLMMLKDGTGSTSFLLPARSARCLYSGTPFSAAPACKCAAGQLLQCPALGSRQPKLPRQHPILPRKGHLVGRSCLPCASKAAAGAPLSALSPLCSTMGSGSLLCLALGSEQRKLHNHYLFHLAQPWTAGCCPSISPAYCPQPWAAELC